MFINYEHISILVKNLPVEDNERCGRLRDHVAVVASAIIDCSTATIDLKRKSLYIFNSYPAS